jgi:hypothetical protein
MRFPIPHDDERLAAVSAEGLVESVRASLSTSDVSEVQIVQEWAVTVVSRDDPTAVRDDLARRCGAECTVTLAASSAQGRRRRALAQDGRRRLGHIIAPVFLHIARVLPDHARVQSALPQGMLLGLVVRERALTKLLARIEVRVLVGDAAPDPASAEASLSNAVAAKLVEDFGLPLLEAETVLRHPPRPPPARPPPPSSPPPLVPCEIYFNFADYDDRRRLATEEEEQVVDGAEEEQTTGGGARARGRSGRPEVVVAHFGEALDWTRAYRDRADFVVYAKSNRTRQPAGSVRLPNVGRESHTYLHHIVSHYDSLANWTVFTHGGSPSFGYHGHRRGGGHLNHGVSFSDYLVPQPHSLFVDTAAFSSQRSDSLFASSLRMSYLYTTDALASNETCPADPDQWSAWWDMGRFAQYVQRKVEAQGGMHVVDFFNQYVRPEAPANAVQVSFPQGARFAATSDAIRARPRAYYEALLRTVSGDVDPWSGFYLEWAWPSVLQRPRACALPPRTSAVSSFEDAMAEFDALHERMFPLEARRALEAAPSPSPLPTAVNLSNIPARCWPAGGADMAPSPDPWAG